MKVGLKPGKPVLKPRFIESSSLTGTILWCHPTKKYGFLRPDSSMCDIFIPTAAIREEAVSLAEGQRVAFRIEEGPKGPMAMDICVEKHRRKM